MPFSTFRSSARATPPGLLGSSGAVIDHLKSEPDDVDSRDPDYVFDAKRYALPGAPVNVAHVGI